MLYKAENTHQQSGLLGAMEQECLWDNMGTILDWGDKGEERIHFRSRALTVERGGITLYKTHLF